MKLLYFALAVLAGVALAVQSVVNTKLKMHLGTPMQATLVSLIVSLATTSLICLAAGAPWPERSSLSAVPWPAWCGGFCGVFLLCVIVIVAPQLGVGVTLALVVAGQMATALWLDHAGWLGMPMIAVTPARLIGASLVMLGAAVLAATR